MNSSFNEYSSITEHERVGSSSYFICTDDAEQQNDNLMTYEVHTSSTFSDAVPNTTVASNVTIESTSSAHQPNFMSSMSDELIPTSQDEETFQSTVSLRGSRNDSNFVVKSRGRGMFNNNVERSNNISNNKYFGNVSNSCNNINSYGVNITNQQEKQQLFSSSTNCDDDEDELMENEELGDDEEEEDDDDDENDDNDDDDEEDCESIDVCGGNDEDDVIAVGMNNISTANTDINVNDYNGIGGDAARDKSTFDNNKGGSGSATTTICSRGGLLGRGRGRPRGSRGGGRGRGRGYLPPAVAEGLARHEAVQQKVYKIKYKQMKNIARSLVLENAALCDTVAEVQQQIVLANEERRLLLRRLHTVMQSTTPAKDNPFHTLDATAWNMLDGRVGPEGNGGSSSSITNSSSSDRLAALQLPPAKRVRASQGGRPHPPARGSKAKRLCPPITLDSAGRPIFPIALGPLTIHSLGEIVCERPPYHRPHVIYPVGFCSSRDYASVTRPTLPATYTCKILDAGPVPRFEIVCEEPETGEELVFSGSSPADCHNQVITAINGATGMPHGILSTSPETGSIGDRGLRFFGLSHPSVQNVLQACPGARKCTTYTWIKFEVCRSEGEVEKVLEGEREAGLSHDALLRNISFASHGL